MSAPFMMMLGPIRFYVGGPAYQQLQRSTQYTWATQQRLGDPELKYLGLRGPALQYIGPGGDSLTLNGTLYPPSHGGSLDLTLLRLSASLGVALPLLDGSGMMRGLWIIESISDTRSVFCSDGAARKIEFTMSLKRYLEVLIPVS